MREKSYNKYFDLDKDIKIIRNLKKNLTIIRGYKIGFIFYSIFTSITRKDGNRALCLEFT